MLREHSSAEEIQHGDKGGQFPCRQKHIEARLVMATPDRDSLKNEIQVYNPKSGDTDEHP